LLNKIGKFSFLLLNKIEKFSFFAQQNRQIFFHLTPKIVLNPPKSANFSFLIKKMLLHLPMLVDSRHHCKYKRLNAFVLEIQSNINTGSFKLYCLKDFHAVCWVIHDEEFDNFP
jgi:hypothetical protein